MRPVRCALVLLPRFDELDQVSSRLPEIRRLTRPREKDHGQGAQRKSGRIRSATARRPSFLGCINDLRIVGEIELEVSSAVLVSNENLPAAPEPGYFRRGLYRPSRERAKADQMLENALAATLQGSLRHGQF